MLNLKVKRHLDDLETDRKVTVIGKNVNSLREKERALLSGVLFLTSKPVTLHGWRGFKSHSRRLHYGGVTTPYAFNVTEW